MVLPFAVLALVADFVGVRRRGLDSDHGVSYAGTALGDTVLAKQIGFLAGLEGLSAEADTADQEREGKDDALYCALQKLVYMIWDPLVLLFPFWHLLFFFHLLFLVVFLSVALLLRVCCSVSFCVSSVCVLVV